METEEEKQLFINKFNLKENEDITSQLAKISCTQGLMQFSEFKDMFSDTGFISPWYWHPRTYVDLKYLVESLGNPQTVKNYLTIMFYYFKLYIHSDIYQYSPMCNLYSHMMEVLEYYSENYNNINKDLKFIRDINQILDVNEINNRNRNNNIDSDTIKVNVIITMLLNNSVLISNLKGEQDFIFKFIIKSGINIFKIQDFEYLACFDNYFKKTNENIQLAKQFYKDHHKDQLNFVIGTFHRLLTSEVDEFLKHHYVVSIGTAYKIFDSLSNEQLTSRSIITKLLNCIKSDVSTFIFVNIYTQRKLPIPDRINKHILMLVQWYSIGEECHDSYRHQYTHNYSRVPSLHLLAPNPLDLIFQALTSLYKHNQNYTKFITIMFDVLHYAKKLSSKYMIKVVEPYIHLFKSEYLSKHHVYIINVNIFNLGFWAHVSHICTLQILAHIFRSALSSKLSDFKSMAESFRISELKNKNLVWREIIDRNDEFYDEILMYALESNDIDFIYIVVENIFHNSDTFFLKETESQVKLVARLLDILKKNQIKKFKKLIGEIILLPEFNFLLNDKIYGEILQYFPISIKEYHPLTTTPNYLVLQELFKYLIFDRNSTSKWKVELSTTSKQVHSIISTIFSNYPIESLEIKQTIKHIGSQYCLFKSPPLHLNHHELSFIPIEHIPSCIDHLESLSHHLKIDHLSNTQLIHCKNLRYLNIFECQTPKGISIGDGIMEKNLLKVILVNVLGKSDPNTNQSGHEGADQHFISIFLDHYDNDKMEGITFHTSKIISRASLSFGLLDHYKQKKPHVHIDVNYQLSIGQVHQTKVKKMKNLHMIKTLELSRDFDKIPWLFQLKISSIERIKRIVFKQNITNRESQYFELLQHIQQLINHILANDKYKSIQLEVYILFNEKSYSFFNEYNINKYNIDFKEFKPIIQSNTNAIYRFFVDN